MACQKSTAKRSEWDRETGRQGRERKGGREREFFMNKLVKLAKMSTKTHANEEVHDRSKRMKTRRSMEKATANLLYHQWCAVMKDS